MFYENSVIIITRIVGKLRKDNVKSDKVKGPKTVPWGTPTLSSS